MDYSRKLPPPPIRSSGVFLSRSAGFQGRSIVVGDPARARASEAAREIKASKGARELAKKRGLDLATIKGTGDNGSVTVEDVRRQFGGI